jgi:hypothetical protein
MKSIIDMAIELKGKNVKSIFNAIDGDFVSKGRFEYDLLASCIMDIVAKGAEGFIKDICERYNSEQNHYPMSDKQRWCVAFAFQKVSDEVCFEVKAEYEAAAAEF